ncbi:hypothetical protein BDA99DRAFT_537778 [Phascolomyces articulosus]|uniref:Uncharacterized protein n=1 Tax=Phascolomyces articulosus TaxID=60185 RepID=A0AAD5PDH9_9FUNG|nr:hypothetical protein BDA99DRAFT_537778 [Phascolomyces articulosus]
MPTIPDWFKAGHWQYLLWYITLSVSVLSSTAICIHASCCRRGHILRGDKTLSMVNVFMLGVTILLITFLGGKEPWTNGIVEFKQPSMGFMTCRNVPNADNDPTNRAPSVGQLPTEKPKWMKYNIPQTHHQNPSSESSYQQRQRQLHHNSVLTRGSSLNQYTSTTPLTQRQTLPEPTLPNMYEAELYGRNYYECAVTNNVNNRSSNGTMSMMHQQQQPGIPPTTVPSVVYYTDTNSIINNNNATLTGPTRPTSMCYYDMNNAIGIYDGQQQHYYHGNPTISNIQASITFPSPVIQKLSTQTSNNDNVYYHYPHYR